MFDNLTSISQIFLWSPFGNVSKVENRKPRSVLPCSEKTKLRLNSGRFGVILSLLVCASLEFGYSCRWKQMYIVKTPAGDIHPYRHPL